MHLELETIDRIYEMMKNDFKNSKFKDDDSWEMLSTKFYHTQLEILEKKEDMIREYFNSIGIMGEEIGKHDGKRNFKKYIDGMNN